MNGLCDVLTNSLPATWREPTNASVLVALAEFDEWLKWFPQVAELLDDLERGRVARRRDKAQARALAFSYAMHRVVLAQVMRVPIADIRIGRDSKGCPRLPGGKVHTSLSHADGVVGVAISMSGVVGIDIEARVRSSDMGEIAGCVAHPGEVSAIKALRNDAQGGALLDLWVRKEAVLKAAGCGLEVDMNTIRLPASGLVPLPTNGEITRVQTLLVGRKWAAAVSAPPFATVEWAWLIPLGSHTAAGA